jgi:PEP-CTERM/exosortase A-associated glycosyltransferase
MTLRILHVLDHSLPLQSGYTLRTRAILQHQRRLGWETLQVTGPKQGRGAALLEHAGDLDFHRTPAVASRWARAPLLDQFAVVVALARRLDGLIAQYRPDLLHAHSPVLDALAALRAGARHGLPVVYEIRAFWEDAAVDHGSTREGSPRYRLTRALETHAARRAAAVVTICEGLREDLTGRGVSAGKITVVPNAVDLEEFPAGRQRDAALAGTLGLNGRSVIGFIGSFYAYEGLALLLEAMPAIRAAIPNVALLLVGGGPQDTALRRLAEARGLLGNAVVFTGRVPHDQVQRYYDLVDVFVYPRLPMRLTELVTPLKPLEAMAQGRLVVASDVGGHRELIQSGVNGELFRAGSAEDLVGALRRVFAEPARWPQWRARARQYVERERNWGASVARYVDVYARALRRPVASQRIDGAQPDARRV